MHRKLNTQERGVDRFSTLVSQLRNSYNASSDRSAEGDRFFGSISSSSSRRHVEEAYNRHSISRIYYTGPPPLERNFDFFANFRLADVQSSNFGLQIIHEAPDEQAAEVVPVDDVAEPVEAAQPASCCGLRCKDAIIRAFFYIWVFIMILALIEMYGG